MDLECTRNQISFYIAKDKHLALAEKLGFFLWLPIGCHLVAKWLTRRLKTRLPKQLQAA